ncbi:MAG TPA: hypothetical protein VIC07_00120 [Acidimicrobiia bacterium]
MKRTTATTLALLVVAACTGGSEASTTTVAGTTSTSTTSTSGSSSTSSPLTSTTTTGSSDTTEEETETTLPPVVAQAVFAFTGGTTPFITVTVEVAEGEDGPWQPAGFFADPTPVLTGASYWVRFNIANRDSLGEVVDVDISGFDGSVIGEDVCSLDEPIPVGGSTSCVVGGEEGFPVEPGGSQEDFSSIGEGERQGTESGRYFQPPIPTSLEFDGARHSFLFAFDTEEGLRVDGTADGAEIEVDLGGFELSGPLRVDCSDPYPGGRSSTGGSPTEDEPALAAYVIENFTGEGESQGGCAEIPTVTLTFEQIESDEALLYQTP